jgi:hypothetical protein
MIIQDSNSCFDGTGIEGNFIPSNWFSKITFDNGKPDLNAIFILSEIFEVSTCEPFISSYEYFSLNFMISKRQVKQAIDRLILMDLVHRSFKTVCGQSNVMYLKLNIDAVNEITFNEV